MRRAVLLALAALLVALPAAAHAKRVRVFAVGPKFDLSWVDTREHFRDKLLALADAGRRVEDAPSIQEGAGDVAGHLLGPADRARPAETARDLVTLPEDLGLMAAFTGQRGEGARQSSDLVGAIARLIGSYGTVNAYYAAKYPELSMRPLPTRLLAVSLTDTFGRTAVETFAELADRYDAYLVAGVNMARDWQVVCTSKASFETLPGGVGCDEENAAKVLQLRAPDEERDYAYEATTPDAVNMALVFDPDGRLVSKQVKSYLTPTELPGQLDLKPGEVSGLTAVDTPVGRLGIVTSKDAWMPDVTTKLDQARVEVLVQPEFFVGDTVRGAVPWAPDTLKASGFSDILRYPSMNALVLPQLTGNVFDFSADAQQAIAAKPRSARRPPRGAFVGQPTAPGLVASGRWIVQDPLRAGEPYAERRTRLAAAGEMMLPRDSSPPCADPRMAGPCRGGQVEDVIFADVQVAQPRLWRPREVRRRRGDRSPFSVNRPLARSRAVQRNVALAARGRRVWAAFEERRGDRDQVVLARSGDEGRRFARPVRPSGRPDGNADEWWPSVAVGPDGTVWLAWQDTSSGTWRVYYARSTDGGRSFGAPVAADPSPAAGVRQLKPAIAATGRNRAVLAFVDERTRFTVDDVPQAGLWLARLEGDQPEPAVRLDSTAAPVGMARTLDNAWAPSITARGDEVLVSWIDFRNYDWDVFARRSTDGGASFGNEQAVNDTPADLEALEDRPRPALTGAGPLVAYVDWSKDPETATRPSRLHDIRVGAPGGPQRQADGRGPRHVSAFAPALVALPGDAAALAWQDHIRGNGDIRAALVAPGRIGKAVRVDDTLRSGVNAWRPELVLGRSRVIAAWEDERDGPAQIYVARVPRSRLR